MRKGERWSRDTRTSSTRTPPRRSRSVAAAVGAAHPRPPARTRRVLLYPEKKGPEFYRGPLATIWEDRLRPMSSSAMQRWWKGCVERSGVAYRPMHEARHTAITDFLRRTGNLKLAQMLAGHTDIGTTANIYAHLDTSDLETALKALEEN